MIETYKKLSAPWARINVVGAESAVDTWLHAADGVTHQSHKRNIEPNEFVRCLHNRGSGAAWEYLNSIDREYWFGISPHQRVEFSYTIMCGEARVVLSLCAQLLEFTVVIEGPESAMDACALGVIKGVQSRLTSHGLEEAIRPVRRNGFSQWSQGRAGYAHCLLFKSR